VYLRHRSAPIVLFVFLTASLQLNAATPPAAVLERLAPQLSPRAVETALAALARLQSGGTAVRSDVLAVLDFSKPSSQRRLFVFDLVHARLLFEELAAHGRNSGDGQAMHFSNDAGSLMSSLGVFLTRDTYTGKHGLSLRLDGLEKGINDNCLSRAIVIHPAAYVTEAMAKARGRIGRSWGCPAVRPEISRRLIETLKGGALLLAWYPDPSWLRTSRLAGAGRSQVVATTRNGRPGVNPSN
jgi:hypothetical protein